MNILELPDEILITMMVNTMDIDVVNALYRVNKRFRALYHEMMTNEHLKVKYIQNHFDLVDTERKKGYHRKGTCIGEGYWETYYSKDKLRNKGNYVRGRKEGYWEFYWDNGQLAMKGSFVRGIEEGPWEHYDDGSELQDKGNYVRGEREGAWYFYNNN
jgi:antitoxin component YwqK of YwqJK toxin-antitoxin module